MWTFHILWFAYRSIFSLKPPSDALISTWVNSVHWEGWVTSIIKVYTNYRLEGVYFEASKYINGYAFHFKAKSRKYQGVFEVKSRVKTWQVRGI